MDIVITYVNGSDPNWISQYQQYNSTILKKRFDFQGQIFFLLKSIECYANWVNRIYIVHANQEFTLDFLNQSMQSKIRFVNHTEIIPIEHLPLFNSCAIELFLWKIPDLSENFLYLNDDVFFGNFVKLEYFIKGKPYIFAYRTESSPYAQTVAEQMYEATHRLFWDKISGPQVYLRDSHTVFNFKKSICQQTSETFWGELHKTACMKVRTYDKYDAGITNRNLFSFITLCNLMMYQTGEGKIDSNDKGVFFGGLNQKEYKRLLKIRPNCFCINDLETEEDLYHWNKLQLSYFQSVCKLL